MYSMYSMYVYRKVANKSRPRIVAASFAYLFCMKAALEYKPWFGWNEED